MSEIWSPKLFEVANPWRQGRSGPNYIFHMGNWHLVALEYCALHLRFPWGRNARVQAILHISVRRERFDYSFSDFDGGPRSQNFWEDKGEIWVYPWSYHDDAHSHFCPLYSWSDAIILAGIFCAVDLRSCQRYSPVGNIWFSRPTAWQVYSRADAGQRRQRHILKHVASHLPADLTWRGECILQRIDILRLVGTSVADM